jgi:hypothetical protein
MMRHRLAVFLFCATTIGAVLGFSGAASAQSLDPKSPTPLAPGENRGTVDNLVGPQYWSFSFKKGKAVIHVRFTSAGVLGAPTPTPLQVTMRSATGKSIASQTLTSRGQEVSLNWPGTFASPGTSILEIRSSGSTLVRLSGDYAIAIEGDAIVFDGGPGGAPGGGPGMAAAPRTDRIVGTYAVMVCPPDFQCDASLAIHFAGDGTVQTTDGHNGTWQVFDPDALIYNVAVGGDRWSLKLVPGRGLFGTNDLSVVIFQAVRP